LEDAENNELRRANGRDANLADQPSVQDVVLRHGGAIDGDEERFFFSATEKRAGPPLRTKEKAEWCLSHGPTGDRRSVRKRPIAFRRKSNVRGR